MNCQSPAACAVEYAFGSKPLYPVAVAVELFHAYLLVHDDIIDGAETRRGKESAYKKFGLKSTLVAGDFLFIKAFEFAGKFDETVVQWTADAADELEHAGHRQRRLFPLRDTAVQKDDRRTQSAAPSPAAGRCRRQCR